jgi:hypothetical protein
MGMRFAKARLAIAFLALFVWVGYIAYQALEYGRFPVLSRAQLLISNLDVVADVEADSHGRTKLNVHVVEVHWPASKKSLAGQDLAVVNLPMADGFQGPGRYILPLVVAEDGKYFVAGLPASPGFEHDAFFIYPDTRITRKQLATAPKPPSAN